MPDRDLAGVQIDFPDFAIGQGLSRLRRAGLAAARGGLRKAADRPSQAPCQGRDTEKLDHGFHGVLMHAY